MLMILRSAVLIFSLLLSLTAHAQLFQPAQWQFKAEPAQAQVGQTVTLVFTATIKQDWYMYSSDFDPDLGPLVTEITFERHPSFELVGELKPIKPKKKFDDDWGGDITYFVGKSRFEQQIKVLVPNPVIKVNLYGQCCSDLNGQCIPFDEDVEVTASVLKVSAASTDNKSPKEQPKPKKEDETPEQASQLTPAQNTNQVAAQPQTTQAQTPTESAPATTTTQPNDTTNSSPPQATGSAAEPATPQANVNEDELLNAGANRPVSLWAFLVLAFLGGLAALLTPCVFPMIPMTVTFFTKGGQDKGKGVGQAMVYGISIIVIYTLIGTVISLVMGPEFANWISTHWLTNLIFFAVFFVFALSFLGMFEIVLPSSIVNKADRQADKGGLYGTFFMAITLVLVSFSCTGPIVGTILIQSFNGEVWRPALGMLAFSSAFAIPFTLFALFPSMLSRLPKSGGWLNSVKVVLGFLELALGLKFLSVADLVYHWNLLDRDTYIVLWIVIFGMMGLYLLGKLVLPGDTKLETLSVPRLLLAMVTFSFVVYLIPGLWGAPLKGLSGYLPPMYTHDFDVPGLVRQSTTDPNAQELCEDPKYADFLHLPHGLKGYFDYDQAMACAKRQNKPLFIDFTGHGCVNCRKMEDNVWSNPRVLRRLKENFVIVALYVDERQDLKESEYYTAKYDGKVKTTIGRKNAAFQIDRFENNAQPYYILLDNNEKLLMPPQGYNTDIDAFVDFLDQAVETYQKRAP